NWTVNGRSILPMAPAVGILMMRRLDQRFGSAPAGFEWRLWWPMLAAGSLALLTTAADCSLAGSARTAARLIHEQYQDPAHDLWFEGHWGFQYYMERFGRSPFDFQTFRCRAGDLLVIPNNNTNPLIPPSDLVRERTPIELQLLPLTTMNM